MASPHRLPARVAPRTVRGAYSNVPGALMSMKFLIPLCAAALLAACSDRDKDTAVGGDTPETATVPDSTATPTTPGTPPPSDTMPPAEAPPPAETPPPSETPPPPPGN